MALPLRLLRQTALLQTSMARQKGTAGRRCWRSSRRLSPLLRQLPNRAAWAWINP